MDIELLLNSYNITKDSAYENIAEMLYLCDQNNPISSTCIDHRILPGSEIDKVIYFANEFIKLTQKCFFAREGERWEAGVPKWIKDNLSIITEIIDKLGLCKEVAPNKRSFQAIALFGASGGEMQSRMEFFAKLIKENVIDLPNKIFLLTGERFLANKPDGQITIDRVIEETNIPHPTEADLMKLLYSDLVKKNPILGNIELKTIDTPRGSKIRPNSYDTLIELIKTNPILPSPILFVSRAPNIVAFTEDIKRVSFSYNLSFEYESVGGECRNDWQDEASRAHQVLMPLGGSYYEGYELAVMNMCKHYNITFPSLSQLGQMKVAYGVRN